MSEYFLVLILSLSAPLILSFYPPLKFYRNISGLIISILVTVVLFGIWDVLATARGHWWFEPDKIWGIHFINLPLEEWLFFIVIPFCCLFTWETIKFIKNLLKKNKIQS
jgi:lycopene cyclase domain-containing protein